MLFRFSLYGFLKNQRYFEPFLVLAFLDRGLSFFEISLLYVCREGTVALLEVPSGAVADLWGRRRSMIASFLAYLVSFFVFANATTLVGFLLAMILFGIGETFRTGTHKAMIFSWLRIRGRQGEKTKVYGYTRSWSKFGSALSAILAALIVFWTENYRSVFYLSMVPYLVNIFNFLGYPKELDEEKDPASSSGPRLREIRRHLFSALKKSFSRPRLRGLLLESVGFEGVFHAVKDYVQPVMKAMVIAGAGGIVIGIGEWLSGRHWDQISSTRQVALLIAPVYFGLSILSGFASRRAHRFVGWASGEERAARWLWGLSLGVFLTMALSGLSGGFPFLVLGFILLQVLQNLWRPVLISRFDSQGEEAQGATLLSIESQTRRVATMALAPLIGFAVDQAGGVKTAYGFWPIGVLGSLVALVFFVRSLRPR